MFGKILSKKIRKDNILVKNNDINKALGKIISNSN